MGKQRTYDLSVPVNNSYTIAVGNGREIISHNTVSLIAGCSPGVHFPIAKYYIRRVRVSNNNRQIIDPLIKAGYKVEPCVGSEQTTVVIEFPIKLQDNIPTQDEIPVEFKMRLAAFMQEHWADNQVSATIDFNPETEGHKLVGLLKKYQPKMKSISFLPNYGGAYAQMPYEPVTKDKYFELIDGIRPVNFGTAVDEKYEEIEKDQFCDGGVCEKPTK